MHTFTYIRMHHINACINMVTLNVLFMLQGQPGPKGQKGESVGLDKVCRPFNA